MLQVETENDDCGVNLSLYIYILKIMITRTQISLLISGKLSVLKYHTRIDLLYRVSSCRAGARTLIGGGGVHIRIFGLCPTNFF